MSSRSHSSSWWGSALSVVLKTALPLALFLTLLRLTLTPTYVWASYQVPGFPPDSYGFTRSERIEYAQVSLDYLLNDEGIEFLGERSFEDGGALFNPRELRHMRDVKQLTQFALGLWYAALSIVVVGGAMRWRRWGPRALGEDMRTGAVASLVLMAALILGLLLAFNTVFVGFHRIFFEGDTWLFFYSDTLIRLFPVRFWQQVFAFLALGTAAFSGSLYWIGGRLAAPTDEVGLS